MHRPSDAAFTFQVEFDELSKSGDGNPPAVHGPGCEQTGINELPERQRWRNFFCQTKPQCNRTKGTVEREGKIKGDSDK